MGHYKNIIKGLTEATNPLRNKEYLVLGRDVEFKLDDIVKSLDGKDVDFTLFMIYDIFNPDKRIRYRLTIDDDVTGKIKGDKIVLNGGKFDYESERDVGVLLKTYLVNSRYNDLKKVTEFAKKVDSYPAPANMVGTPKVPRERESYVRNKKLFKTFPFNEVKASFNRDAAMYYPNDGKEVRFGSFGKDYYTFGIDGETYHIASYAYVCIKLPDDNIIEKHFADIQAAQNKAQEALPKTIEEADEMIKANGGEIPEEWRKQFFKKYGTMNGMSDDTLKRFNLAEHIHKYDMKKNPSLHSFGVSRPYRGFSYYVCSCGFSYSVDSSD